MSKETNNVFLLKFVWINYLASPNLETSLNPAFEIMVGILLSR